MKLNTYRFGEIEIDESRIIHFKDGLPGLEELKNFVVVVNEQTKPFYWLQAIDEDISLPVVSPFDIDPDYSPLVDDSYFEELEIENDEDILVLNVAVIPQDITKATVNMMAPIIINSSLNKGKQIVIEGIDYQIRQPIIEMLKKLVREA